MIRWARPLNAPQWCWEWVGPWQTKSGLAQTKKWWGFDNLRRRFVLSVLSSWLSFVTFREKRLHRNSVYSLFSSIGKDQKKDFTRPNATGEASGAVPPKWELCPPKRRLYPKESNRLGATGMQFESVDSQNTGCHSRIREEEPFFRRFCNKDLFFRNFTQEIKEIRKFFEIKTFFFGLHPRFCGNLWWKLLSFGPHSRIWSIELFVPPQNLFMPPVTLFWRRACTSPKFNSLFRSFRHWVMAQWVWAFPSKKGKQPSLPRWQHWLQS